MVIALRCCFVYIIICKFVGNDFDAWSLVYPKYEFHLNLNLLIQDLMVRMQHN